jgi:hypothetical protein
MGILGLRHSGLARAAALTSDSTCTTPTSALLEVTGKARHDDVGNNQSFKINKFRHADSNRGARPGELRPQAAEGHHELAAKIAARASPASERLYGRGHGLPVAPRRAQRLRTADVNTDGYAPVLTVALGGQPIAQPTGECGRESPRRPGRSRT